MSDKRPIVVIGLGELGAVFATGFLKLGYPVFPVLRGQSVETVAPGGGAELVLVAVGEKDLGGVLEARHAPRERLVLMQNELLPLAWERLGLEAPNVVVVWFEKKRGRALHNVLPSVVCGPQARLLVDCLAAVDVPARRVEPNELLFELVQKNLYILVHNICGLVFPGTVAELWNEQRSLAEQVAREVLDLQFALVGRALDRAGLLRGLGAAVEADPTHACAGRSAAERLRRALGMARELSLAVPRMTLIERELGGG